MPAGTPISYIPEFPTQLAAVVVFVCQKIFALICHTHTHAVVVLIELFCGDPTGEMPRKVYSERRPCSRRLAPVSLASAT